MTGNETCFVCLRVDSRENLGAWLVGDERRAVHLECWLALYEPGSPRRESGDITSRRSSEPGSEQAS